MALRYTVCEGPFEDLIVAASDKGLVHVGGLFDYPLDEWTRDDEAFVGLRAELAEYFSGSSPTVFETPMDLDAGTPFEQEVWQALSAIPYGSTTTYGDLARSLGRPNGARAVGGALARNPLPIVVPCHRVIGRSGKLVGYQGGKDRKAWLLGLERRSVPFHGQQATLPFFGHQG